MSELEDQLNHILNDPAAMGQIAALAQSLGLGGDARFHQPPPEERPDTPGPEPPPGAAEAPPPLDPKLMQMGMRLLSEYNRADDRGMALLDALRPFLKPARRAKLDRAIQLARLSRVARVALGTLKEQGGDGHV